MYPAFFHAVSRAARRAVIVDDLDGPTPAISRSPSSSAAQSARVEGVLPVLLVRTDELDEAGLTRDFLRPSRTATRA